MEFALRLPRRQSLPRLDPAGRACLVARQFQGGAIFKFFEIAGRAWLVSPALPALSPTLARQPDNLHQKALFGIVKTYKKLPKNLYDFFCVFACFSCISMLGLYQNQKAPTNQPTERQEMTTATEKKQDKAHAVDILTNLAESIRNGKALVQISTEYGKGITDYLRVSVAYPNQAGEVQNSHLTWAIGKLFGYSLRERNGRWYLAISGGGYSKAYEIADTLARYFQVERLRYEEN